MTVVVAHRLGDIGKRGALHHATCSCGQVFQRDDADAARLMLRQHIVANEPGGDSVVTLAEYRDEHPPATNGVAAPELAAYPCIEPGCDFVSTRPQGLSRHRNQSHGVNAGHSGEAKLRHARREAPPAAREAVGYEFTITLDSERTDVLAALSFVEEKDADALIGDVILSWLAREVESDPALAGLAAARARRRG